MSIYTLIEYSDNYEKTTESLWQYCRDEPDDNDITGSELSKFKWRFTTNYGIVGTVCKCRNSCTIKILK